MSELLVGTLGSPAMLTGTMQQRKSLLGMVEASPIDHLFIADHVSFHTGLGMDGIVNAATLAAMSPSTSIFIGVYLLALRHPVIVARQLSSLSLSAPGRIILGVGVGGEDRHEMEICGVDPARRGKHTNHSLEALGKLMTGQSVSHHCEFFSFDDAKIAPAPSPAIPIVVGGRSDAAVKRAATQADGWLGVWCSPTRFAAVLDEFADLAAGAGRVVAEPQHGLQVWVGFGEKRQAREILAKEMQRMYKIPFERFEKYCPWGSPEDVAEFLLPYVERGARLLNILPCAASEEEGLEAVAKVAELLKGTSR